MDRCDDAKGDNRPRDVEVFGESRSMPYYRRNIYVLSFTVFLAAVSWNQVMPYLPLFLKGMGVREGLLPYWIGIAFAAQSLASMLAQPFWGKLGDSRGRKPMIIRAGLCLAGVYFGMSFCQTPWQLALLRFLNGALTGFIPGSYALIATNTPEDLAPRSVATAQAAANAGLIVGPALGGLLAGPMGYRGSMQLAGVAVLICTMLVWWLVQEPNKVQPGEKTSMVQDFAVAIRSPIQSSLLLAVMIAWIYGAAIGPYLTLHLTKLNGPGPEWLVGVVYALPAAAFILTARTWTSLGEQWGYERSIVTGLVGGAVAAASLAFAHTIWTFGVLYFISGVWLAAMAPSVSAITCTRVEESFRGRAYAIQQSAGTFGALIAPLVAAKVAAGPGISGIFVMNALVLLIGAAAFRAMIRRWGKRGEM